MITPEQLVNLKPGDILTVRVVAISAGPRFDVGDHVKVRTGDKRSQVEFYAPLEQIDAVIAHGDGDFVPRVPAARNYLAELCGPLGRADIAA